MEPWVSAPATTRPLTSKLLGTISGFSAGNGKIDVKAKGLAVYNSKTGDLSLERVNGTLLANVFLNTSGSYATGFRVEADSAHHAQIVVGATQLA